MIHTCTGNERRSLMTHFKLWCRNCVLLMETNQVKSDLLIFISRLVPGLNFFLKTIKSVMNQPGGFNAWSKVLGVHRDIVKSVFDQLLQMMSPEPLLLCSLMFERKFAANSTIWDGWAYWVRATRSVTRVVVVLKTLAGLIMWFPAHNSTESYGNSDDWMKAIITDRSNLSWFYLSTLK